MTMRFVFKSSTLDDVVQRLKHQVEVEEYPFTVAIQKLRDDGMKFAVSKLGTSEVEFSATALEGDLILEKTSEDIAWAHKKFYGRVVEEITNNVEKCGGSPLAS